ncbi:hypothetical protein [Nocardioides sp. cx-173]|uniref:hypothetical protein n=1 Tax=Nocardioides sp. cx-173 TaxID=2898796 RepID=UPI001E514564|nr:hypothetical protein [Nocardioides sp. cx-173]MCD4526467.1 hypothetical protein [Nocardioides sp. cx-173]UGB41155.1 hypothetical protein LQ940_17510 [Nocardioides sp. cx-173]
MNLPLWVPWVLALTLAFPVALQYAPRPSTSRAMLALTLVPALVMALYAVSLTLDRSRVSQEELDEAAREAAADLSGSLGPVNGEEVASLMAADLGRDVISERGDLQVADEQNAAYVIEVRAGQDAPERACLEVSLELLDQDAPDLRLATVEATSGGCG